MTDVEFKLPGVGTSTSWAPPVDLSFEQWKDVGCLLECFRQSAMWWIGDWWAFGQGHYGERANIVNDPAWDGPSFQTCMNAASVCRRFETSRRREVLTFKHHAEVAALPPETADWLLDRAMPEEGDDEPRIPANRLRTEVKKYRREEREQETAEAILAMPNKRYGVLYADPEWRFEPWSRETGMDRAADNHYPTSELEDIKTRDVASIAADNCVLFIWATLPMIPQAIDVMSAWGFAYKSACVWRKDRVGTGYWFRNRNELLLVGVRGDVPAPAPGTQWESEFEAPIGEHSEKPERAYELIESYFPNIPKIELNARRRRAGWDAWGLEAPQEAAE